MNRGRRRFLALAAVLAPTLGAARSPDDGGVKTVGYLSNGAGAEGMAKLLAERGHVLGRNLRIEVKVAPRGDRELEATVRDLVLARPHVLVAWGARNVGALARQTRTIPIVCGGTADPVGIGYAKTLHKPGGNITGLSYGVPEMSRIIVGLIHGVLPGMRRLVTFVASREDAVAGWTPILRSLEEAAREQAVAWEIVPFGSLADFERVLAPLDPRTSGAYLVDLPKAVKPEDLAATLIRRRMVSSTNSASFARAGMLMHYSINHADELRRVAAIVDAMLRGADPASHPFELPDRTELVLNRATARAIGLVLPPALLARATEIIG